MARKYQNGHFCKPEVYRARRSLCLILFFGNWSFREGAGINFSFRACACGIGREFWEIECRSTNKKRSRREEDTRGGGEGTQFFSKGGGRGKKKRIPIVCSAFPNLFLLSFFLSFYSMEAKGERQCFATCVLFSYEHPCSYTVRLIKTDSLFKATWLSARESPNLSFYGKSQGSRSLVKKRRSGERKQRTKWRGKKGSFLSSSFSFFSRIATLNWEQTGRKKGGTCTM